MYGRTGTIRKNRIDKLCPILDVNKVTPSESLELWDLRTTKITRSKDNVVVSVVSSLHGKLFVCKVKGKNKHVEIEIQKAVKHT